MRHALIAATLLSVGLLIPAAAQPVVTGPASGAAAGAATGAAVAGPMGAAIGAPVGAVTGAAVGTAGAVAAPVLGTRVLAPGLPPLPPGTCYAVNRRGALRTDRAGRPRMVRC
jgi:hypothetical protein